MLWYVGNSWKIRKNLEFYFYFLVIILCSLENSLLLVIMTFWIVYWVTIIKVTAFWLKKFENCWFLPHLEFFYRNFYLFQEENLNIGIFAVKHFSLYLVDLFNLGYILTYKNQILTIIESISGSVPRCWTINGSDYDGNAHTLDLAYNLFSHVWNCSPFKFGSTLVNHYMLLYNFSFMESISNLNFMGENLKESLYIFVFFRNSLYIQGFLDNLFQKLFSRYNLHRKRFKMMQIDALKITFSNRIVLSVSLLFCSQMYFVWHQNRWNFLSANFLCSIWR